MGKIQIDGVFLSLKIKEKTKGIKISQIGENWQTRTRKYKDVEARAALARTF